MADIKLFEKPATTPNPASDYRLPLGKAGVPWENITLAEFYELIGGLGEVVELGNIDMSSGGSSFIDYTPPAGYEITDYNCKVIDDDENLLTPIDTYLGGLMGGYIQYSYDNERFQVIYTADPGYFGNSNYNSVAINRGFIYVKLRKIPV